MRPHGTPRGGASLGDRPSATSYRGPTAAPAEDRLEAASGRILGRPLALALGLLAAAQLATWLPHYLTWPYWADHDVFATAARSWTRGRLPYRDVALNNFPGALYLFAVLGRVAGWGRTWPIYAFDAGLVVGLGGLLIAWSRRRLGRALPGLVAYLAWLSYTLQLDYSLAAQRDGHAAAFMAAALLILQAWPGRAGRTASALAAAAALTFRPQAILFAPALALALRTSRIDDGADPTNGRAGRPVAEWCLACAGFLILAALPLLAAGVFGDFLRSVRLAGYGGGYSRVTARSMLTAWIAGVAPAKVGAVAAAAWLLGRGPRRSTAWPWLAALAGVSLYKPLSPVHHSYLDHPLTLVWAINLALVVRGILDAEPARPSLRLAAILLVLGLSTTLRPAYCALGPTLRAAADLRRPGGPVAEPPGYWHGTVPTSAVYPWRDYRDLLEHLRAATGPSTSVANLLKQDPAITGPVDRESALPAESIAWLRMVRRGDEGAFARALERADDSVVVWIPDEVGPDPTLTLDRLIAVVERSYRFEARFGAIEVWRRRVE